MLSGKTTRSLSDLIPKGLTERNVAVAELDHQDLWQRSTIGVVSISSSNQNLRQVLEGAQREAEGIVEEEGMISCTIELMEL